MNDTLQRSTIAGGILIAVEGIDGAGKTTLARALCAKLQGAGIQCVMSKEPTTGPFGMKLRESAATGRLTPDQELELLIADRKQHVAEFIAPSLAAGKVVILDRYYLSNAAYQGAEGLDVEAIMVQNESFAPKPNLLMVLDLAPEAGLARIAARGDKPNHFETPANLARCRAIFGTLIERTNANGGVAVELDANDAADAVLGRATMEAMKAISASTIAAHGLSPEAGEALLAIVAPALR